VSRSRIAGALELSCDGELQAVLRDWWLDGDGVTFTMELPLPLEPLHRAPLTQGHRGLPRPDEEPDAVLQVLWDGAQTSEARLRIPPMNAAVAAVTYRIGEDSEPALSMTRSVIRAGQWIQEMKFEPLPPSGELAFRLTSRVLGIRSAVDVVSVERLRSRII
jgi:hypothetical protein